MKNFLIILLLIIFSASCQTPKSELAEDNQPKIESTPTPKAEIPELTKEQLKKLGENIPTEARKILENADEFEVKSVIAKVREVKNGLKTDRTENVKKLNDKQVMNRLIKAIFYDVATSEYGLACLNPTHNLYAKIGKKSVNLEFHFGCLNLRGSFSDKKFSTHINNNKFSKEIFDQILQNAEDVK